MKFGTKVSGFLGALIFAGSSFATQIQCPSLDVIKAEGLNNAENLVQGIFLAYNLSQYETDSDWAFILGPLEAKTKKKAIQKGNALLNDLEEEGIPMEADGKEFCQYPTGNSELLAVAVQADDVISSVKMQKFLKSKS